jgi:hypothetical protein
MSTGKHGIQTTVVARILAIRLAHHRIEVILQSAQEAAREKTLCQNLRGRKTACLPEHHDFGDLVNIREKTAVDRVVWRERSCCHS